ncbi:MAG: Fur family transcriptional regulator [Candidatus Competibacterales bacterium]
MATHQPIKSRSAADVAQRLRDAGIAPTRQRMRIATALLETPTHLSAQELYAKVNRNQRTVCRATVYNTLNLFVSRGLVREIPVDANQTFYDSNVEIHHHIFNVDTGELVDIEPDSVIFKSLPPLPADTQQDDISLIIRVRNKPREETNDTQ